VTGRADGFSGREGPGESGKHGVVPDIQGGELDQHVAVGQDGWSLPQACGERVSHAVA
jgi:hypothetical protein